MPDLLAWFTDHESALSGIAALIAIVAAIVVILSPLGAGVRGLLSRSKKRMPFRWMHKPQKRAHPQQKTSSIRHHL